MSSIICNLREYWLSSQVDINTGITHEEINEFEKDFNVSLPTDLRKYFYEINGFDYPSTDKAQFHFWSMNKIRSESDNFIRDLNTKEKLFVIADCDIEAYLYLIILGNDRESQNKVFLSIDNSKSELADSFSDFIKLYLNRSDDIIAPFIEDNPEFINI